MDIRQRVCDLFLLTFILCIHEGLSNIDDDYEYHPSYSRCPWLRNKLKNGRVRYRYKGRVAKFLCDSGFELAGKRSSTCVRGMWSNPLPVCVARGCARVPSIPNGRVTEMYRGALLVYDCNPGYTLDGDSSIHCDGRRWNTSPPACIIATDRPETYCDFENPDLCGWSHDPNHDFDWKRNQFTTPSGHVGTGPSFDHTFGENRAGFYLYIEASSPRKINDTARLFSPVYSEDLSGGCFVFWYHMYGATTGGLRVYLKPESHVFDELRPTWAKYGDQGNQWLRGTMIVPVLHENFQIVIEGLRGESYVGDSAIDDVRLTTGLCEDLENNTDTTESISQDSCRGRCRELALNSSCGCSDSCFLQSNCCSDYITICGAGNDTVVQNTDEPLPGSDFGKTSSPITTTAFQTTVQNPEGSVTFTSKTTLTELTHSTVKSLISNSSEQPTTFTSVTPRILSSDIFTSSIATSLSTSSKNSSLTSSVPISVSMTDITTSSSLGTRLTSSHPASTTGATASPKINEGMMSTVPQSGSTVSSPTTVSTSQSTPQTEESTQATIPSTQTTMPSTQATVPLTKATMPSSQTTMTSTQKRTPSTQAVTQFTQTTTQYAALSSTVLSKTTEKLPSVTTLSSFSDSAVSYTSPKSVAYITATESTSSSTTAASTSMNVRPSVTTMSSTRKTYNLRPRTQKTTPFSSTIYTTSSKPSTKQPVYTSPVTEISKWYRLRSTSTAKLVSTSTRESTGVTKPMFTTSSTYKTPETTFRSARLTTKFADRFAKSQRPLSTTSDYLNSGASKAETPTSSGSAPAVISIVVVALIISIIAVVYYYKNQRSKRQSKLSDDSEMRFLPESDYMEYSEASALDKIFKK